MPAGTPALVALATQTLSSSTASLTFSSITAGYRDLIVTVAGSTTSNQNVWLRFNGDTASNYSVVFLAGGGSTAGGWTSANVCYINYYAAIDTTQGLIMAQIMDFSASDKNKIVLSRAGSNSSTYTELLTGRWSNNSAITSVQVSASTSFAAGSVISLYGVAA